MEPIPFLNVTKSVTGKAWVDRLDHIAVRTAGAISQQTELSDILARVLAGRGVGVEGAERFLTPTLRELMPDPSSLMDMDRLVNRLAKAVENHEQIALFGDYDVDGASSVSLMARFLTELGLSPVTHIPDRIFEGYGPNIPALDQLINDGASLIITLDCGTTSNVALAHAVSRNADVLVIDHHLAAGELPETSGLVNPNRPDDISELGYLCAAGVTFMVLVALHRKLRENGRSGLPNLMGMVDLVALATICDVVPLIGLNRAFVQRGLEAMREGRNRGISALALAARVSAPLNSYHLGFMLGPRINAGGRIGDASLGARLLSSHDEHEVLTIAARLDELNADRQRIEKAAVDEATAVADAEIGEGAGPSVLVLASEEWHPGVVGLVAARLKERFDRPAFAIALAPDGTGTGSGRSMPGVDLGKAVLTAVEEGILVKGGGHAMAAGVTVLPANLGALRAYLNEKLAKEVDAARLKTSLKIDAALTARGATVPFVKEVERAGPFGMGNSTPIFAFPAHKVKYPDIVGQGGHVRFTLGSDDGASIKAIAFRASASPLGKTLLDARDGRPLHLCGTLGIDHYQGREKVQLRLIDAAVP